MQLSIKFTDMERDEALCTYVEEKIETFSKRMEDAVRDASICNIEFKKSSHQQKGDVCYAEITLESDGALYRASMEATTLREALDRVKDEIMRQMSREKEKKESLFKRGSRLAKRLIRGV